MGILATTDLPAQARLAKAKPMVRVYYYYGVQKMTGALQLLASSADPNFFGQTYGQGQAASDLFNAFAIVYRSTSKLTAANLIWRDDHGQPGIRWNQHVQAPSGPPLPPRQWATVTNYAVTNLLLSPPLPEAPAANSGGANVLPDTTAPVVTSFGIENGNITNFPTRVLFSSSRVSQGWWTDPESGQSAGQVFDLRFSVQSNSFYTAWSSENLTDWLEYPTPLSLHPARWSFTNEMYFPIMASSRRFFTLRCVEGGARTTWQ